MNLRLRVLLAVAEARGAEAGEEGRAVVGVVGLLNVLSWFRIAADGDRHRHRGVVAFIYPGFL